MATYKLIQNVEAEDHIIGPLTLRQFIFALIAAFFFYLGFLVVAKWHTLFLLALFMPPGIFFGFFAIPFGRDQPTEVWFLAKLRFWFKPRRRIWSQSGVKELVTITAPKKVEKVLTNGLSPYEVDSRLKTLAKTLDSRGWAIKDIEPAAIRTVVSSGENGSDRLIGVDMIPAALSTDVGNDSSDMLDEQSSPVAHNFEKMINLSNQQLHQRLIDEMNNPIMPSPVQSAGSSNQWFMQHLDSGSSQLATVGTTAQSASQEDQALLDTLMKQNESSQEYTKNMHTLIPASHHPVSPKISASNSSDDNLSHPSDPAIISLANRDDMTVQTIAHEAKKALSSGDEVAISLH